MESEQKENLPPLAPIKRRPQKKLMVDDAPEKGKSPKHVTPDRQRNIFNYFTKSEEKKNHQFGVEVGCFTPIQLKPGTTVNLESIVCRPFNVVSFDYDIRNPDHEAANKATERWKAHRPTTHTKPPNEEAGVFKAKFLKFYENFRPPYYGTWSKKSTTVCGRRPFALDAALDYQVDSELEWEEESGEDLDSDSGDPQEDDRENSEESEDGFLVPHGYLSGDEGIKNSDEEPEEAIASRGAPKTAVDGPAHFRRLKPLLVWADDLNSTASMSFELDRRAARLIQYGVDCATSGSEIELGLSVLGRSAELDVRNAKEIPDEALTVLIRVVHNNIGIKKLIQEFKLKYENDHPERPKLSKNLLTKKIQEMTVIKSKKYIVLDKYLQQYAPDLIGVDH